MATVKIKYQSGYIGYASKAVAEKMKAKGACEIVQEVKEPAIKIEKKAEK